MASRWHRSLSLSAPTFAALEGLREPGRALVCVVDDAHWLDRSSTQALVFAARRLRDEGVALLFAAPASYTGEDLVEFQLHGSQPLLRELLDRRGRRDDLFLVNPQGLHWSEITPSDIVMADGDGTAIDVELVLVAAQVVAELGARLAIRFRAATQPVGELSGGNQQKVALARLLHPLFAHPSDRQDSRVASEIAFRLLQLELGVTQVGGRDGRLDLVLVATITPDTRCPALRSRHARWTMKTGRGDRRRT